MGTLHPLTWGGVVWHLWYCIKQENATLDPEIKQPHYMGVSQMVTGGTISSLELEARLGG